MAFLNIGFGNIVNASQIITMISPDSAPAKRLVQKARESEKLVDATQGRKTKGVIVAEGGIVILSALRPATLAGRKPEE